MPTLSQRWADAKRALERGELSRAASLLRACAALCRNPADAAKMRAFALKASKLALASLGEEGLVARRRARSTGTMVGLYHRVWESDPETPWSLVCQDHGGIVCFTTRKLAETAMSQPNDWCPYCSGEEKIDD